MTEYRDADTGALIHQDSWQYRRAFAVGQTIVLARKGYVVTAWHQEGDTDVVTIRHTNGAVP